MAGEKPGDELSDTAKQMRSAQPYLDAVWKMVGGAIVGVGGGWALDRWLGTAPWLLISLSLVGIGVGMYAFLSAMMKLGKKK